MAGTGLEIECSALLPPEIAGENPRAEPARATQASERKSKRGHSVCSEDDSLLRGMGHIESRPLRLANGHQRHQSTSETFPTSRKAQPGRGPGRGGGNSENHGRRRTGGLWEGGGPEVHFAAPGRRARAGSRRSPQARETPLRVRVSPSHSRLHLLCSLPHLPSSCQALAKGCSPSLSGRL